MEKRPLKIVGFCIVFLVVGLVSGHSNPLEQIGLLPLQADSPTISGTNTPVAVVEGSGPNNSWQINPGAIGQPVSKFRWISSGGTATTYPNALGTESGHANAVAANLFATAPGLPRVDNYDANYFYNSIVAPNSQAITTPVVNQSFIFPPLTPAQESTILQQYDTYAASRNVLFVSGLNNCCAATNAPAIAYNSIAVGVSDAPSATGPTADGRSKPDITAPGGATSFATPYVSGAAALLIQAAGTLPANQTTVATNIRTLKAMLLNGAVKPAGWTNSPTAPLDTRHGSGVLNVLNSYKQLVAGKQTFQEATSHTVGGAHPPGSNPANGPRIGWDLTTITNLGNGPNATDRVHHYYFQVTNTPHVFTATLTWNRAANSSGINNLNLYLYNATSGSLVAASTSGVDNLEHIYIPQLAPGRYDLQVWKGANQLTTTETYALAFEAVSTSIGITRSGSNVLLSWPTYPNGFTFQTTSSLDQPISWSPAPSTPTLSGQSYQLLFPATAPQAFYRLRR